MSFVTGLFFLVILLNQQWSPALRLQASHCSTFRIMCDVPSRAVFCSESIQCFPGTASKLFIKLLVTIPVAPIITGVIVHFRFIIIIIIIIIIGGTRWRSWLRHCATSRKVAGSIPDGVVGFFHGHNPSGPTVALGSTQPLAEMSTRNVSWGVKGAGVYGWQPCHLHVPTVLKSGSLNLLEPLGPV
jgi:hypothetical protein